MQCLVDSAKEFGLYPKSNKKPLKGFIQAGNTTRVFFFFFKITKVSRWRMGHQGWKWGDQIRGWGNKASERKW